MKSSYAYENVDSRLIAKLQFFNYNDHDAARAIQYFLDEMIDEAVTDEKKTIEQLRADLRSTSEKLAKQRKENDLLVKAHQKSVSFQTQNDDYHASLWLSKNPFKRLAAWLAKWPGFVDANQKRQYLATVRMRAEMQRQDVKWGEARVQPNGTGAQFGLPRSIADDAKKITDFGFASGKGTWAMILLEEVAEALVETNPRLLKEELNQVAAVAGNWAVALDTKAHKGILRKG